jgi:hypothetical protein
MFFRQFRNFGKAAIGFLRVYKMCSNSWTAETPQHHWAPRQLHDAARNVAFIAAIAATIAGSWIFTGKWWKA